MLCDENDFCRVWSASSLMQMIELQEKIVFAKKIIEEKDLYACGIIVEATQIIFSKKRTSSNAVENKESAKIEKTKNLSLFTYITFRNTTV
ncbi:hypothetical protein [Bulleidia extructa]|uniref:hypothetical protein n=1 Tax=Bulleidia extructa TaxID=118748 RepID=UPI003BF33C00